MHELMGLIGIMGALIVGVVSPGPSFVMVARMAVASSRAHGICAALGMGLGGVVFAVAALLGLQAVLLAVPALYLGLKIAGGLYLCYLGFRIFGAAKAPLNVSEHAVMASTPLRRSFWLGFATQASNPKTAIVYASVFAAFLPQSFSWLFAALLILVVFAIETGWYTIVAMLLSSPAPRRAYLSYKTWVDRMAGAVMMGLGLKLVASAGD